MRCLIVLVAAVCFARPVLADPLPSIVPTHDVSGTYQLTNANGTQLIAVEYGSASNVLRLTPLSGGNYILYDFSQNDAKMVLPSLQHYYEQPDLVSKMQVIQSAINNGGSNFTVGGQETIAGDSCTDYSAASNTSSVLLCIAGDGIILRFANTNGDSFVAQTLSSNPVPQSDLQLPPGYTELTAPP